ncbi:hypothetical protein PA07A_2160 [Cutibacterium acnes P07A]|nr:hypothetical protein [Cutibacterium acnes P07A]
MCSRALRKRSFIVVCSSTALIFSAVWVAVGSLTLNAVIGVLAD